EKLRELAALDLADPKDPRKQVAVGDGWWDQGAKLDPVGRSYCDRRADQWYSKALLHVTPLVRAKLDERMRLVEMQHPELRPPEPQRRLALQLATEGGIGLSPDGTLAATITETGLSIWDVASGKELKALKLPTGKVIVVAFSTDGRWLASAQDTR